MKVLHVLDRSVPNLSGYSLRSAAILTNQKAHGLNVIGLTSPKHDLPSAAVEHFDGIDYYRCRIPDDMVNRSIGKIAFLRELGLINTLAKEISTVCRQNAIQLIHAHSPSLNGLAALHSGRKLGIPVVYEVRAFWEDAAVDHGTFGEGSAKYRISSELETYLFKKANAVVTICNGLRNEIKSRGIPGQKIHIVPNGVDLEMFVPRPKADWLIRKLGIEGKQAIGFIGSLFHYEGLDLLLKAFVEIAREKSDVVLLIVGDGRVRSELELLNKELKTDPQKVRFLGRVPHAEILDYYSVMDILVYPRHRIRLTELVTPLKPLEAMAMGKTIVGSLIGGIAELIDPGKTGLLFEPGVCEDLVRTLSSVLKDPEMGMELGQNARKEVEIHRSWKEITRKYLEIYECATAGKA